MFVYRISRKATGKSYVGQNTLDTPSCR
jgi:hypothetical protein